MKTKLLLLILILISFEAVSQILANQVDDFEDGTTQNWGIGGAAANQPTNVATGGPDGADDNFFSYTTTGNPGGPGSKMIIYSREDQWSGDFTTPDIVAVRFNVRVTGEDLFLRVALSDQPTDTGSNPTQIISTNAVTVASGSGWVTVTIPVEDSDFTYLTGPNTIADVLMNVAEMRIIHNSGTASWVASAATATLDLDNITALTSLGINEQSLSGEFKILKNPASSKMMLQLPKSDLKMDVFDVLGKKIVSRQLNSLTSSIDVSKWNNGVYLVRVTSDKGTHTKRFVKQ